jgi:hypothetical protein
MEEKGKPQGKPPAKPEQKKAVGLEKEVEVTHGPSGDTRTITLREWRDNGFDMRSKGWTRVDEADEDEE